MYAIRSYYGQTHAQGTEAVQDMFAVAATEYYAFERSVPEWTLNSIHAVKISMQTIIGFSVFAFLFSLINDIIKDCEDYNGDIATGVRSIPVVLGKRKANYVISTLSFISITLILVVWHGYFSHLMFFRITSYNVCYTKLLRISYFKYINARF